MEMVVSASFGEIVLKGLNRAYFERVLFRQVEKAIQGIDYKDIYKEQGKIYVVVDEVSTGIVINRLKKVFGLVNISPCYRVEKDIDTIINTSIFAVNKAMMDRDIKTFKVKAKRADKKFPLKSMDLARKLGGEILKGVPDIKVDVHNPDLYIYVDIRDMCYIYTEKIKAYGGLPIGTNGKGLLLLSGGIDSPVAGFLMAKRGVSLEAVHFHSYPFTSQRSEEKVKEIAKILSRYCGQIKIYSVNLLNIQKSINENCPEDEMTIISRRFMMRIAEKIAKDNGIDALITGESLGQVASQTIMGINATNSSVNIPVFRPLIGMDKVEITEIAKDIETYETSILPYEDCCTVFLPKHPVTRPKLEDIENSEKKLDVDALIKAAIEDMKIINV